jgi:hypothetical protein
MTPMAMPTAAPTPTPPFEPADTEADLVELAGKLGITVTVFTVPSAVTVETTGVGVGGIETPGGAF